MESKRTLLGSHIGIRLRCTFQTPQDLFTLDFWGWCNWVVMLKWHDISPQALCFNMLLNPHVHVLLPRTWSLFNSLVCHVLVWQPLEIGKIDRYPHPSLHALIHGRKNKLLHVACSTKTLHVCVTYSLWQAEITRNREKVVNRLRSPRVSPHYCFIGGVKFPQGEGSAVIHCKKNDPLHKDGKYI